MADEKNIGSDANLGLNQYALEAVESVTAYRKPFPKGSLFTVNGTEERDKYLGFKVQRGKEMVNAFREVTPHADLEAATQLETDRDTKFDVEKASRSELEAEAQRRGLTVKGTGANDSVLVTDLRNALRD